MRPAATITSCLLAILVWTAFTGVAAAEQLPTPDQVLNGLGYSEEDKRAIRSGLIIARDLPTVGENQLKGAVAMRVAVSIDRVAQFFEGGRRLDVDATVETFGVLRPFPGENDWQEVRFAAGDEKEVARILMARPGSTLNLSREEIAFLQERLSGLDPKQPKTAGTVNAAYRDVLAGRFRSYLEKGLDGMPPFARAGGGHSSPADEIRADFKKAPYGLLDAFPAFRQAILDFPRNQPPGVVSDFFWIRTTVEGRPHYALAHQMMMRGDGFLLVYSRDYFAAHTYNALQARYLWLTDDRDTFGFDVNAGNTDEITGLFGAVAKKVGQDRMKENLTTYFRDLRARLTR